MKHRATAGSLRFMTTRTNSLRAIAWLTLAIVFSPQAKAQTCDVPAQYPTVQAAVADPACSTVVVAAGNYAECITIDRTLTLQGAGPACTILAGPLSVEGADTELTLLSFGIDSTAPPSGCSTAPLAVTDGATVYPADMVATNVGGIQPGSCSVYADGFEALQ